MQWLGFHTFQFCYPQHANNFSARLKPAPFPTHCCLWCLFHAPCIFNILRFPMQQKLHFPQCSSYGAEHQLVSMTPSVLVSLGQLKLNFQTVFFLGHSLDKPQVLSRTPLCLQNKYHVGYFLPVSASNSAWLSPDHRFCVLVLGKYF